MYIFWVTSKQLYDLEFDGGRPYALQYSVRHHQLCNSSRALYIHHRLVKYVEPILE